MFVYIFYDISYPTVISSEELCFVKRRFNKKKFLEAITTVLQEDHFGHSVL